MIGYAHIAGGAPSASSPMTEHLLNNTLQPERSQVADYYARGMVKNEMLDLAKAVAAGEMAYSEALAEVMQRYIRDGGDIDQLGAAEERLGKRLADLAFRIQEGLENAPLAVVRPDVHPAVLTALGIEPDGLLSKSEINALLAGRRADGEKIEGKKYSVERQMAADPKTGERRWSTPIGSTDFCPTPDKSVSVAWAFASDVERAMILQAHLEAAREAVAYIAAEVGKARIGNGGEDGFERGHMAWLEFTHHTTRKTVISVTDGVMNIAQDTTLPGDPDLHTHFLIPNAVFCDSGRVGSIDTAGLRGFIFEADAFYQAWLAQKLRDAGFDVVLDERTGAARMPVIPEEVARHYSKRSNIGEALARRFTSDRGENWDDLSEDQKAARIKTATQRREQRIRGEKDDVADFAEWKRQAKEIGWEVPRSLLLVGPTLPPLSTEQRHRQAYDIALPWLSDRFEHRAVLPHYDLRVAALRGLIATGLEGLRDVQDTTALMRREGVTQYGTMTAIEWGQESGKRHTSITTTLHREQEAEFIELARTAAGDKSGAIPAALLKQKVAESGLDFADDHGKAQRAAIDRLAAGGRFGVAVGTAGSGKTAMLTPLVAAWREMGKDVWGASLAWRQTDDLVNAGIDQRNLKAFSVLMDGIDNGSVRVNEKSVVCVDELGLLGTRQALQLLRAREKHGFTIVTLGDDKQCQSIEAGAIIDLSRRALGAEQVPEILTTKRQATEREREIVGLLRDGRAAEALDMKRADRTAEMVAGGRQGVIERVAKLYTERLQATGEAPTISAPTNQDAHQIGEAVRGARRDIGLVGADLVSIKATDGDRDYTLRLAKGDRVRLFESTMAVIGNDRKSIGRNGSVVEVLDAGTSGVTLRAKDGRTGTVRWNAMQNKGGRVVLAYGDAATIHSSQGMTTSEHIFALPSGSAAVSGAAGYTASTRHRSRAYLLTSEAAERIAIKEGRPLNDAHEITLDDKWANVARNFVNRSKMDSAVALIEQVGGLRRGAVKEFHKAAAVVGHGPDKAGELVQRRKIDLVMQKIAIAIRHVRDAYQPHSREHDGPSLER